MTGVPRKLTRPLFRESFDKLRIAAHKSFYIRATRHHFPMLALSFFESGLDQRCGNSFAPELRGNISVIKINPIAMERIGHVGGDTVDLGFKSLTLDVVLDLDFHDSLPPVR